MTFTDGRLGHVYQVVGSASVLLFESDRSAILDRVDAFYRKIDTTTEWIFLTLKRAQRVETQLDHVERWARRHSGDAQLSALLETRRSLLAGEVGDFLSIQQYLVLRSDNAEALHKAHALVITEAAESPLMLRTVEPLGCERALGVLAELFSGR